MTFAVVFRVKRFSLELTSKNQIKIRKITSKVAIYFKLVIEPWSWSMKYLHAQKCQTRRGNSIDKYLFFVFWLDKEAFKWLISDMSISYAYLNIKLIFFFFFLVPSIIVIIIFMLVVSLISFNAHFFLRLYFNLKKENIFFISDMKNV